ncbi:hypothetical protein GIB67_008302 [Kingdonia uniflora]|uniref:Glycosyltransferase n=1 Tax=Kingdonia uniflora TaxID=39325 RepID=A0A7J7N4W7_9MAGN|nr:hypothetical protein GIB67_008302 [Kingdonia uniflora]
MEETYKKSHIIILSSPGISHLISLGELAKRLILHQNFSITIAISDAGSPSKTMESYLESLPKGISYIFLGLVSSEELPKDVSFDARIGHTMSGSLPSLCDLFENIITSNYVVVALVVDIFGVSAVEVCKEYKVPMYVFFTASALTMSFALNLPKLDELHSCDFKDLVEPIRLPGCVPLPGEAIMDALQDKKNPAYKSFMHIFKQVTLAEGILVNSFMAAEPGALSALMKRELGRPPVYPVGPLIRAESTDTVDGHGCLEWLDRQPGSSVLFIAFGSAGTLTNDQITELAFGLELSQQRFLWVTRSPSDTAQTIEDPLGFLPNGFLGRTRDLGLVVPSWGPQIQVLAHGSTGGFLTHCGWNSALESIVHGVPLIVWPLFAEQKMNAVLLVDDMKIALRPKVDENGLVGREEIAIIIKGLMDGEEGHSVRKKVEDLKDAAAAWFTKDRLSTLSLLEVAHMWMNPVDH